MTTPGRRGRIILGLLSVVVGFAVVTTVRANTVNTLAGLSQAELIRILDEAQAKGDQLAAQNDALAVQVSQLESGADTQAAAAAAAALQETTAGILAGRLPVHGPGVIIEIDGAISAATFVSVITELRNAGAEAIEINGIRVVASTYFTDTGAGVAVSGTVVSSPFRIVAIGDPQTLAPAMQIPGGAFAQIRTQNASPLITPADDVRIDAVLTPPDLQFAVVENDP